MIVPFSHMSGFIISGYKPLYTHLFDKDLTFTFENYVKCQVHLPIIPDLYDRNIYDYVKAMRYLKGDREYKEECGKVLLYFYKDMTDMICSLLKKNPTINTDISISVESKDLGFPLVQVGLNSVVEDLNEMLEHGDLSKSVIGAGIFTKFTYQELNKLVPSKLLALASILFQYSNGTEVTILEVDHER